MIKYPSFSLCELSQNVVEITVEPGVKLSIEDFEQLDSYFNEYSDKAFGFLVNRKHDYDISPEAKFLLGSNENIKAIAVIVFDASGHHKTQEFIRLRRIDNLNLRVFSGLDHGREKAIDWLSRQLTKQSHLAIT